MGKRGDVASLFSSFEKEISTLESKKHKTESDLDHLSKSLKSLEKQQQELNRMLSGLMHKDEKLTEEQVSIKDRLGKQTSKLEKLKMLYEDLKEV